MNTPCGQARVLRSIRAPGRQGREPCPRCRRQRGYAPIGRIHDQRRAPRCDDVRAGVPPEIVVGVQQVGLGVVGSPIAVRRSDPRLLERQGFLLVEKRLVAELGGPLEALARARRLAGIAPIETPRIRSWPLRTPWSDPIGWLTGR